MVDRPKTLSTRVTYELTRQEIEEALKRHLMASDGSVTWDITSSGKVRGASVTVIRTEIQGDFKV